MHTKHRRVSIASVLAALVALGGIAGACSVYDESLLEDGPDGGVGGSSAAGGVAGMAGGSGTGGTAATTGEAWWPYTRADGCESAGTPVREDRPEPTEDMDLPNPIYVGITKMRFGAVNDDIDSDPEAWKGIGLDIDNSCQNSPTCDIDGTFVNEPSCTNDILIPGDGDQCRDNSIGKLFQIASESPLVGQLFGVTEENWNCAMWRGEMTMIIKITNYNGKKFDDTVRVDMYASTGLEALPAWQCEPDPANNEKPEASWKNQALPVVTKKWKIADESISPTADPIPGQPANSKTSDPAGFVRDGWLFASFGANAEFWLNGVNAHVPGFRLLYQRGFIVGKLAQNLDGQWTIEDGVITGALKPDDVIAGFEEIGYCQNMCDSYTTVIQYVNTNQDLLSSGENLPEVKCDALSFAVDFDARQVTTDDTMVVDVPTPTRCPPPRNPMAPEHGCTCPPPGVGGECVSGSGGTGGMAGSGSGGMAGGN